MSQGKGHSQKSANHSILFQSSCTNVWCPFFKGLTCRFCFSFFIYFLTIITSIQKHVCNFSLIENYLFFRIPISTSISYSSWGHFSYMFIIKHWLFITFTCSPELQQVTGPSLTLTLNTSHNKNELQVKLLDRSWK